MESHARAEGSCQEEGVADKNCCVLTIIVHLHLHPNILVWVEEAGEKEGGWLWERRGEERYCSSICLFVSCHPNQ